MTAHRPLIIGSRNSCSSGSGINIQRGFCIIICLRARIGPKMNLANLELKAIVCIPAVYPFLSKQFLCLINRPSSRWWAVEIIIMSKFVTFIG